MHIFIAKFFIYHAKFRGVGFTYTYLRRCWNLPLVDLEQRCTSCIDSYVLGPSTKSSSSFINYSALFPLFVVVRIYALSSKRVQKANAQSINAIFLCLLPRLPPIHVFIELSWKPFIDRVERRTNLHNIHSSLYVHFPQ